MLAILVNGAFIFAQGKCLTLVIFLLVFFLLLKNYSWLVRAAFWNPWL